MTAATKPLHRRRRFLIGAIVVGVPILALAWYLGSPLFLNKTVVEDFPATIAADPSETPAAAAVTSSSTVTAAATTGTTMTHAEEPAATPTTTLQPADPMIRYRGSFQDADSFHHGSGKAAIFDLPSGARVLRFEGLDVTNGPGLHVILSPVAEVAANADVMTTGYVDLGSLKGNRGDQNYDLPADFVLDGPITVVIYCEPFHVIFASAPLTAG